MRYLPFDGNSLAKDIDPPQRRSDGILATRRPTARCFYCHGSKHKGQEPPPEEQHGQRGCEGPKRPLDGYPAYTPTEQHETTTI